MKKIPAIFAIVATVLCPILSAAPYDTKMRRTNAAGTATTEITLADPGANSLLMWNEATNSYVWTLLSSLGTGDMLASANLSDVASLPDAKVNIGVWTDIDRWTVGDGTSNPVSEWLTGGARDRGYANLAAISAAYPCVASLTDEIDWAVIQGELDKIGAKTITNRTITLAAKDYTIKSPLTIKGDGVKIQGQGPTKTNILCLSAAQHGILFGEGAGVDYADQTTLERFSLTGLGWNYPATGTGIVAGKYDLSEDYYNLGLTIDTVRVDGFQRAMLAANFPMLHCVSSVFIGGYVCVELAKCDTFVFESCATGNAGEANGPQYGICFKIRNTTGSPGGGNFGGTIIGGEHGNTGTYMELSGSVRVVEIGANHENLNGPDPSANDPMAADIPYKCRMTAGSFVGINNRWGSLVVSEPVWLLEPNGALYFTSMQEAYSGGFTVAPIWVKGNVTLRNSAVVIAPQQKVGFYNADVDGGALIVETKQMNLPIPVYDAASYNALLPASVVGNALIRRGEMAYLPIFDGQLYPDDLVFSFMRADGTTAFRSSLINDHLWRRLGSARAQSMSGTDQEPLRVTVPENACWKVGQALVFEASGTATSSGVDDALKLWLTTKFYDSNLIDIDGFFRIIARMEYVTSSLVDISVTVTWKGGTFTEQKSVQNHSFGWTSAVDANRQFLLQTTGALTVHSAILEMRGAAN